MIYSKRKVILEIGSGQGFNSYLFSKNKNNKVIAIDLSKEDIRVSKKRYPNINFMVMNAEKMSFKDNFFDEVYALDVLEHVDNLDKVLNEAQRVLKKNGKLKINIPYYKSEHWLLKLRPTFHKEIHHVRIFKENQLDNLLKKKQFKLIKKERKEFLQHIELYFLFIRKIRSKTQLSIGSWRDTPFTKIVHVSVLYFNPSVIKTPLIYLPIWIVTVPVGAVINYFVNKVFPRSLYYEFIKE